MPSPSPPLRTSLLLFTSLVAAQQEQCYWRSNAATGVVTGAGWFACNNTQQIDGGAQLCCLSGSECGTDALCHQSSSGGGSGWFVGGCTDATYEDPVCRSSCTGDAQTWIQYNYTSQLWQCCGDNACTGTPTGETFQAAPPGQFSAVPSGPQSSTSGTAAPTSAPPNSTLPSTSPSPAPSSGMSTGVKAGLGVLAAVAAFALAAAIAFAVLWRRAKKMGARDGRRGETWQQEPGMQQQPSQVATYYDSQPALYQRPPEEMGSSMGRTPELAGEETRLGSK